MLQFSQIFFCFEIISLGKDICICGLQINDRGQDVFNQLSDFLDIKDFHLFGLSVQKGEVSL